MQQVELSLEADAPATQSIFSAAVVAITLGLLALDVLIAFEAMAVTTVMPVVATALNGLGQYALAFSITVAASILGLVAGGRWSDGIGSHQAMRFGVLGFTVGLFVSGTAGDMTYFLLGRALQGFGGGAITVAMYVIIARRYAQSLQPRIFAALSAAWVVPAIVGPALAGWIAEHIGWRSVFLVAAFLVVPCVGLLWPTLRSQSSSTRILNGDRAVSMWTAWFAALSLGGIGLAGQRFDGWGIALTGSLAAIACFATVRLMPQMRWGAPGLATVILLRGAVTAAFFGTEAFVPLLLTRQRQLSVTQAGVALTVGALGWSLGAWLQRDCGVDRTRLLRLGSLCLLGGIVLSATVLWPPMPTVMTMIGWAAAGTGMGLLSASLSLLVLQLSPQDAQGRNSAAMRLMESACTTVSLALAGSLFALLVQSTPTRAFVSVFALMVVAAIIALGLASRTVPVAAGR